MEWLRYMINHTAITEEAKQRIKTAVTTLNDKLF